MEIRNIAFTDLEMSGLDPKKHEIIEMGLILADAQTLEILERLNLKIQPEDLASADPASLVFNGYSNEEWTDAVSLKDAMTEYARLTQGALFAAWNSPYDWSFIVQAFYKTGLQNSMDYHTLDVFTAGYEKLAHNPDVEVFKLSGLCKYFGIPKEPMPHRAINGAERAYEVYKKLKTL